MMQILLRLALVDFSIGIIYGTVINSLCGGEGWVAYEDEKCFKLIKTWVSRDQAEEICNQQFFQTDSSETTLASIKSAAEQDYLTKFVFNTSEVKTNIWIGAKKMKNGTQFLWNDGSVLGFTNWVEGSPSEQIGRECVEMQSGFTRKFSNISNSNLLSINGKWKDVTCESGNYVLCQKLQTWSFLKLQKSLLNLRKELTDSRNELNNTRNELNNTRNELERMINQQLEGVERAFISSFEVGGSSNYYYPVAFRIHDEDGSDHRLRTPLIYDIYRLHSDKSPQVSHYIGLTLKLMCTDGGWDGGANALKVLLHTWKYDKGVAMVRLFDVQEYRLFVWLRGGGVLYHIRSPVNLTQRITIYLEDNAVAAPAWDDSDCWGPGMCPAVVVNPIAVGNEDPNLVKPGVYAGWGF